MRIQLMLDPSDLIKASMKKPSHEVRIEDFPSRIMRMCMDANFVQYTDHDGNYKILKDKGY
jgi:hypothetical protein